MYEGKEICQGCQKPGTEKPRQHRHGLCSGCNKTLRAGAEVLAIEKSDKAPRIMVRQHFHAFKSKSANDVAFALLSALNEPNAPYMRADTLKYTFGTNQFYIVREDVFEALKPVMLKIDEELYKHEMEMCNMSYTVRDAVAAEKERIYNEGVQHGRNLLMQLNSGTLTLSDLDKNVAYTEK
jgi:hypothetical protein